MRLDCLLLTAVAACSGGVKFIDQPMNNPLPEELATRAYFTQVGAYSKNLDGLVGHILYPHKKDGKCDAPFAESDLSLKQYLREGVKLTPDNQAVVRYESKIDKSMSANAGLFGFAASLTAERRAETNIIDAVTIFVDDDDIPTVELQAIAAKPLPEGVCARYYVRGATLSILTYKTFQKIDGKASTQGNAFGAEGQVFGQGQGLSVDMKLSVNVLPIRHQPDGGAFAAADAEDVKLLDGIAIPADGFPPRDE